VLVARVLGMRVGLLQEKTESKREFPYFGLFPGYESLKKHDDSKPAVLPSSRKEAPSLLDPLDPVIVSQWPQHQHSACSDMRLGTDQVHRW